MLRLSSRDLGRPVELCEGFEGLIFEQGERRVDVDLSKVDYLSSLMIGALVSLHLIAYENLVELRFVGITPRVKALLRLVGVDELIKSHSAPPKSTRPQ